MLSEKERIIYFFLFILIIFWRSFFVVLKFKWICEKDESEADVSRQGNGRWAQIMHPSPAWALDA